MKSCAIICLSPYQGGMELDSMKIANLLSKDVIVYYICKAGTFLDKVSAERFQGSIKRYPIHFSGKLSFSLVKSLKRIFHREKVENILFFGASELGAIVFASWSFNCNIIIQHGTTKRKRKNSPYHQLIYKRVNWHIAVSEHIASNLQVILPCKAQRIKVIYTALDFGKIKPVQKPEALTILHIGRISQRKGQLEAVSACSVLKEFGIDFKLKLIGSSDSEKELQDLHAAIQKTGYSNSIEVIDFTKDVGAFYQNAKVLLFPSYGEGMSNVILEALAYRLQCVCFSNTSFPELRKLGLHLYLAENKNIADLKDQLLMAIRNLEEDSPALEKNFEILKANFSIQTAKEKIEQLLV